MVHIVSGLVLQIQMLNSANVNTILTFLSFLELYIFLQGLFVPFARVGSSDPVRVLRLLHKVYTG